MSTIKNPIRPGDGDERHGTVNGYSNHGCRCVECTDAWRVSRAEYMNDYRRKREHARRQRERYQTNKQKKEADAPRD